MNAKEAKQKAYEVNNLASNSQYNNIIKDIKNEAKKGCYQVYIYIQIKPDVRKKLQEDGFKVGKETSDRDGYTTLITWM